LSDPLKLPLIQEIRPAPDVEQALARLARRRHCLLLDSALRHPTLGRYSFLAVEPFEYLELPVDAADGLAALARVLSGYRSDAIPDLPPFQGGAAGLISYDLGRQLERLPTPAFDEFRLPALAVGLYDVVLAIDHVEDCAWVISHGYPEQDPGRRYRQARERLDEFLAWLAGGVEPISRSPIHDPLSIGQLAPSHAASQSGGLWSNFSESEYLDAVSRAIEYVHAGDVFQVNIAQRLLAAARDDSLSLYLRLRKANPATFGGYLDLGPSQILSASPERFLQVRDRQVETRPIKGTRPRTLRPEADLFTAEELRQSEKDRAENVMIVDLLRNDLSRVCRPESVRVGKLCEVESYAYVQHLVSVVLGRLRDDRSALDLVRAAFPGGSVTGCPKVRAMEIITELERVARGAYCGSLGYLGFDGTMDLSILIRTITAARGWWQSPVGGGIVAQSVPRREYAETWHKAEGMLRAMV
jgi:para-aminobenzoate synthetase component 1